MTLSPRILGQAFHCGIMHEENKNLDGRYDRTNVDGEKERGRKQIDGVDEW